MNTSYTFRMRAWPDGKWCIWPKRYESHALADVIRLAVDELAARKGITVETEIMPCYEFTAEHGNA